MNSFLHPYDLVFADFDASGPRDAAELSMIPEWISLNGGVAVSEPGAITLLGLGLFALEVVRRSRG